MDLPPRTAETAAGKQQRRVLVAGATGFVGRAFVPILRAAGQIPVALVRPGSPTALGSDRVARPADSGISDHETAARAAKLFPSGTEIAVVDLGDAGALDAAAKGAQVIVQLIGTTRRQFKYGDSYEKVDYGTTVSLVDAAKRVGVPELVLLSAVGASAHGPAYSRWKHKTERYLIDSGLGYTIVRPSFIAGPGRELNRFLDAPLALVGVLGLRALADHYRSISADELGRVLLGCVLAPQHAVIEGSALWAMA